MPDLARQSKGARLRPTVRLKPVTVEALRAIGLERGLEGLGAAIDEAVALRGDRDASVAAALEEARLARVERDALRQALADAMRRLRYAGKKQAVREAKRRARQAAPQAGLTPQAAFARDHVAGLHAEAPLAGLCPSCPPGNSN